MKPVPLPEPGQRKRKQMVPVVHRTFQTGAQVGYCWDSDGEGFRFLSRGDQVSIWHAVGPVYQSWVSIADLIDSGALVP